MLGYDFGLPSRPREKNYMDMVIEGGTPRVSNASSVEDGLRQAALEKRQAKLNYDRLIRMAHNQGMSNVKIASIVGLTEAAVRMYRKRHNL